MTNPTASDIRIQASLSEHYFYTQDAPIAPGPLGRFVSVFDGSVSHLLTVDSSGQMLHFMPDPNSQSGWSIEQVNVPTPPNGSAMFSIKAFFAYGQLNVLVLFEAAGGYAVSWIYKTGQDPWEQAEYPLAAGILLTLVSQLNGYTDGNGNTCVYGVAPAGFVPSNQFFVLVFDKSQGIWNVAYQDSLDALSEGAPVNTEFHIIPKAQDPNHNIQLAWVSQTSLNTVTTLADALLDSDNSQFTLAASGDWKQVLMPQMTQPHIASFPGQSFQGFFLLLDESGALYLAMVEQGGGIKLNDKFGPSNIATISLSQVNGSTGQVALFAIEAGTNSLWIARQNANDQPPFFFGNWANLGNYAEVIAAPEFVQGGAEVYFADAALNVRHLAQNTTDGIWATRKLAAPVASTNPPQKDSAIMVHVSVVDANDNPVPNAPISVASDQWANIVVDELSYMLGPGVTISIQADATGNADIFYPSTSLAMPIFTLSSGSAQNSCQGDVVFNTTTPVSPSSIANRLAGNDPDHPINQTTLQNAKLLAPNTDPTPYIQAINQLGQAILKQSSNPGASLDFSSMTISHWRIDFTHGGATFRVLTEAEATALRASLPAAGWAGEPGSIFSDIIGDVTNFLTNATKELVSVAVDAADDALNVVLNGVNYVVKTARQISAVVQMIFAKIAEGLADVYTIIKEVIQFLEMLFHWADILATHRVFKACINSFFQTAETYVSDLKPMVQAQISYLQKNLAGAITDLQQQLGSQTFNEYVNSLPSPGNLHASSSTNVLSAQAVEEAYQQNLSRFWYVFNKAKNYFSIPSMPGASASTVDLTALLTQVAESWGSSAVNFTQQVQQIVDAMPQQFSSFSDLFDLGIVDFLQLIEDFVQLLLSGLEAIVQAVLDLIDAALKEFQSVINATIDIPVISWLYKHVITGTPLDPGDDLTILDLLCLVFAVPATILYKLVQGGAPFSSSDANYFEQNGLAWPTDILPGKTLPAARATSLTVTSVPAPAYVALGLCGAYLFVLAGGFSAGTDVLAFAESPPKPLIAAFSFIAAFQGALRTTLVAPWSLWAGSSSWATVDYARTTLWCAAALAAVIDLSFVVVTKALPEFGANAPEFPTAGPILAGGMGTVLAAAGLAVSAWELASTEENEKKYSGWDIANATVPQCIRIPKFLIVFKNNEVVAPFASVALLVCDALLAYGSFATQAGATVWDWQGAGSTLTGSRPTALEASSGQV